MTSTSRLLPSSIALLANLIILTGACPAHGDEPIRNPSIWRKLGYIEQQAANLMAPGLEPERPSWDAHALEWPVQFEDSRHSVGNSMLEFQSYGQGPYFHGGCDLRVAAHAPLKTPVAGRIEAGHYGYSNNPDGSMKKHWKPWPAPGDTTYFEIAVITDDGYRFEYHHMDEKHIAPEVLRILKSGNKDSEIAAGSYLGDTLAWPGGDYHHTHYNIITPSGVRLNPEFYSSELEDKVPPVIHRILASKGGRTSEFGTGEFAQAPDFFAIATNDHLGATVYEHPPVYVSFQPEQGDGFAWDFRERLIGPAGTFPGIWSFFIESIQAPNGERLATEGGYGTGVSIIRLPVPKSAKGNFTIEVSDLAGGTVNVRGSIRP